MKPGIHEPPLLELFTRLREAGLPLGIDDYWLFLRALEGGFGHRDRTALRQLCKALWVKSEDDERIFNYQFDQVMHHIGQTPPAPGQPGPEWSTPTPPQDQGAADEGAVEPMIGPDEAALGPTVELSRALEDEVQVAQSVLQLPDRDPDAPPTQYLLTSDYLPITRRQMKQSWRHLRQPIREGPATELDLEATVDGLCRHGLLLEPARIPPRRNRAELILLIDQGGSMVPFHAMSGRLIETAVRGGRLGRAGVHYFHNCPTKYLYDDPVRQYGRPIDEVLDEQTERSSALIFSDAGAARGGFVPTRIDLTEKFLEQVARHVRRVAWLNPMPRTRWSGTSAGVIEQLVPMLELNQRGLHHAIDVLRGRSTHGEAIL